MAGHVLRVMTFNIRHGLGLDGRVDLGRVAEAIRGAGAELVGLQEVDRRWGVRSAFRDQAAWLGRRLGMHWGFASAMRRLGGAWPPGNGYGNALLSRHPIAWVRHIPLARMGTAEDRVLLAAGVDVPGLGRITAAVTHLGLDRAERLCHAGVVIRHLSDVPVPVVLMGDWNDRPDSPEVQEVALRWADVARQAEERSGVLLPTFRYRSPGGRPNVRIDYIFASSSLAAARAWTVDSPASDHLPLVADLVA